MQFYLRENKKDILTLYYIVNDNQLSVITNHQHKLFPIRFFTKKIFCPMLNEHYAWRVASEKTNWLSEKIKQIHILRFLARSNFIEKYTTGSLDNENTRICIPSNDLSKLNQNIIGHIEKIHSVILV